MSVEKVVSDCDVFQELNEQLVDCRDPQYAGIIQTMIDHHMRGCDICKKVRKARI